MATLPITPRFSLDALTMFYEVVATGSLTRASDNLSVAKSTVSRQLTMLEKQVGVMLLKRSSRRVVPTEVGMQFYEQCKHIFRATGELGRLAEASRGTVAGTIRVALPTEFGSSWMGKAIAEFAMQFPDIRLNVEVRPTIPNLLQEPYDLVITFGKLRDSQLICRNLVNLSQAVYASPAYLETKGWPRTLGDLLQHEFVLHHGMYSDGVITLTERGRRRRLNISSRIEVNNLRLARELASNGMGLSILPRAFCRSYVQSGSLVPVGESWNCPSIQATAIVLTRRGLPRKTRTFLEFIAEQLTTAEKSTTAD